MKFKTTSLLFSNQVKDATDADIPVDNVTTSEVNIELDPANEISIDVSTSDRFWIPFYVKVPPEKRVKLNANLHLPSADGKGTMHAIDAKFEASTGKNILCTKENIDVKKTYSVQFEQTSNITAFMQVIIKISKHLIILFFKVCRT